MFTESRERASGDGLKAAASEVLHIFPLLRHFAATVVEPTGQMATEIRALRGICAVLDGFLAVKFGRKVDMVTLVAEYLSAHKAHTTHALCCHGDARREACRPVRSPSRPPVCLLAACPLSHPCSGASNFIAHQRLKE